MRNDRGNVECRFVAGNLWWQVARCGVSEITIHSLRSNWPGARREGGSVSAARRRCCSLLTDPLRDMLWCPCGSTSRLASAQNPLPRMYSYFGDTTLAGEMCAKGVLGTGRTERPGWPANPLCNCNCLLFHRCRGKADGQALV